MKGQVPEAGREVPRLEIPEDVAVLYTWANLQGARYHDYSASRRQSRGQLRQRAAETEQASRALSQAQPEDPATAINLAGAEDLNLHGTEQIEPTDVRKGMASGTPLDTGERTSQDAGDRSRLAARERVEAARRAEALRGAEELARREPREIAEAGNDAAGQAQRRSEGHDQDSTAIFGRSYAPLATFSDPYTPRPQAPAARVLVEPPTPEEDMRPERFPQRRRPRTMVPSMEQPVAKQGERGAGKPVTEGFDLGSSTKAKNADEPFPSLGATGRTAAMDQLLQQRSLDTPDLKESAATMGSERTPESKAAIDWSGRSGKGAQPVFVERRSEPRIPLRPIEERAESAVPAWIHGQGAPAAPMQRVAPEPSPVKDTLQHSRERVASRWYALRGVFDPATPEMEPMEARTREAVSPVLAVFSLAGGVGKTSLTASLGRSLSAVGEKVLLADLTPQGILPFYFGATELRPGAMRTFTPPEGSADAPVTMLSYDVVGGAEAGEPAAEGIMNQLARGKEAYQHVLADLGPAAATLLKRLARLDATVLVPVAPDMNTVISLASMERFFAGMTDSAGGALQPRYLLTQFEATLPLHLDVREGLRQKLGHRLLPFAIRRSPEVSEALAEGMTVIDYAPESGVAADYRNVANWLRSLAAPGQPGARAARWSER
ncbi:MAG: cellulose synthase operon protein YhjQ/BcsQ [Janthinobacterium lividum]